MSYAKMAQELRKATKNVDASDRFMQALEARDLQQKAEYDRIIAQMHQDNKRFIDIVERELQLQNKHLRFLSWAIPAATGILALLIIIFGVIA